jgi:hypothetical protein
MTLLALLACQTEDLRPPGQAPSLSADQVDHPGLTELGLQALELSPAWIQPDLELALSRMDETVQDDLASLLVDLDEPWLIDEVAFSIAHTSIEVLAHSDFYPELLVDNARWIYEVEPSLRYVELVDVGEPGVDADFHTTTRYAFDVDGVTEQLELDPESYYWHIVHPRIEDERPFYIDAWDACSVPSLECASNPEDGMIWREFLWQGAAETCPEGQFCPVLSESLTEAEVLWSSEGGGVGAIGAVAGFMLAADPEQGRWLTFGAYGERSIQPNRIYALGRGNCGEWGDMTTALSRTVLIPNVNATPASWDHTWNEFWDPYSQRWVAWEPVNWWFDHAYGAPYVNHVTRGDARVIEVTDHYTDNSFDWELTVLDAAGQPVDGANVALYTPWAAMGEGLYYAVEGSTDRDGVAVFTLSAEQDFYFRVETELGNAPAADNTVDVAASGVLAGETQQTQVTVEGARVQPIQPSVLPFEGEGYAVLEVSGAGTSGRVISRSKRYGDTFTVVDEAPALRWMVMQEAQLGAFESGQAYTVAAQGLLGEAASVPLGFMDGGWSFVLVADGSLATASIGSVGLALSPGGQARWEAGEPLEQDFVLLPGEHLSWSITK